MNTIKKADFINPFFHLFLEIKFIYFDEIFDKNTNFVILKN